jgi:tRNA nucleotidyltransferase (CCA-adding enzyme)
MEIYLVGGAVRDSLLLAEYMAAGNHSTESLMRMIPKDFDHVVVGATEQDMLDRGYKRVGEFFPVFISDNNEEFALARKERKVPGENSHTAFTVETDGVTLEDDLYRRDLTINAIAAHIDEVKTATLNLHAFGNLGFFKDTCIDPFDGIKDLENRVLRHISPAFAEDPLRVLRVAKFAARYPEFTIAPETLEIMKQVAKSDEFKKISPERVLKEMIAAFKCERPSIFFEVLKEVGGLSHFFPELERLIDVPQRPDYHPEGDCWVHTMLVLDAAAKLAAKPGFAYKNELIFSALVHDLGKGVTPPEILPKHLGHEESGVPLVKDISDRLRVPLNWKEAALVVTRYHLRVHRIAEANGSSVVRMFYEFGAFKKPNLVEILARACEADDMGKYRASVTQGLELEEYFNVVKDISSKDVGRALEGKAMGDEIRAIRVRKLKAHMATKKEKNENV